jgi:hypothetical protein
MIRIFSIGKVTDEGLGDRDSILIRYKDYAYFPRKSVCHAYFFVKEC